MFSNLIGLHKKCLFHTIFPDIYLVNCWLISFLITSRTVFVYITTVQYKTNYYSDSPNLLQQSHFFRFCLFSSFLFFSLSSFSYLKQDVGKKDENCRQKSASPEFCRGLSWEYWQMRLIPQPQTLEGPQIRVVLPRKVKKPLSSHELKNPHNDYPFPQDISQGLPNLPLGAWAYALDQQPAWESIIDSLLLPPNALDSRPGARCPAFCFFKERRDRRLPCG